MWRRNPDVSISKEVSLAKTVNKHRNSRFGTEKQAKKWNLRLQQKPREESN